MALAISASSGAIQQVYASMPSLDELLMVQTSAKGPASAGSMTTMASYATGMRCWRCFPLTTLAVTAARSHI